MNLFDIWLISVIILVGVNILLVSVLFNKIGELKIEKRESHWWKRAFMNEQKRAEE
tara:strand:+ start:242 stop:409 length:168 start_codon:yes stop_codon:yes gene_type:complete